MPFDYRELIYREVLSIDQSDELYYFKRFKRLLLILGDKDRDYLETQISALKRACGVENWPLFKLERKLKKTKALKVRTDYTLRLVPTHLIIEDLTILDNWADTKIRDLGRTIRFSNMGEIAKVHQTST